ncbi:tryptophan 7-halogenase [Acinetobacter colistiniresistens]|uniref:tryptophan 7-halogenase n=1 Tax=Acinetobacter colistiniresistens TaxID=280145 RepID=UPI001250C8DA|nr:tryptophan 7-halogenase [Acinetobacter colistiniresistens]
MTSPEIPIVGVGEGGILNLMETLHKLKIPFAEFMQETDAIHKLGFVYEGWRDNKSNLTDCFYHMFPMQNEELLWKDSGYYPILSMMLNHNLPISYITESINLSEKNISQEYLTKLLLEKTKKNFASSFHFDTYKVGQYLKRIALQRGVKYKEGLFNDVIRDSQTGLITDLYIDNQVLPVNFVIDASGFSRQIMGKVLKSPWTSFEKYLPANTAIPFHLKHLKKNPDLVTRSTAMDAGWVWQIPLKDRVGAGYVFDRNFISPDEAVKEVEQWLGHEIDPIRTITFEAGCYEKIWIGNVLSVGLASGFVEPLEATSIGQMLYQLSLFAELVIESHGVVSKQIIDIFNEQNLQGWHGIRDFIRMHYDTP